MEGGTGTEKTEERMKIGGTGIQKASLGPARNLGRWGPQDDYYKTLDKTSRCERCGS